MGVGWGKIANMKTVIGCACAFLVLVAGRCWADTIETTDGRRFEGRVLSKSAETVVFEVKRAGASIRMSLATKEVASIKASAEPATAPVEVVEDVDGKPVPPPIKRHVGPVFYRIPLRGTVGQTLVASGLQEALADASKRSPSAIILEVDSPGGDISEIEGLAIVIGQYQKRFRIIVWVRSAISAAAITALCAEEIYVQERSVFGAATAYHVAPDGTPENIEEKARSIWRSQGRNNAVMGKHSPLLAEGMIDASGEIHLVVKDGVPVLYSESQVGSTVLKEEGKILMLTGPEAVACGLAKALANNTGDIGKAAGFPGWTECEGIGEDLMAWREKRVESKTADIASAFKRYHEAIDKAALTDPGSFEYGGLYADDVKLWNNRSTLCADQLGRASASLFQVQKLMLDCPWLCKDPQYHGPEWVSEKRKAVDAWQTRLAASRLRVPFEPTPQGERGPSRTIGRLGRINN